MNAAPLFSVLINVYNGESMLGDALTAVRMQSCKDYEVVIVDDGSQDASVATAEQWASQFPNSRVITKSHTQLADSRNYAMRFVAGKYIAVLDVDDLWHPDYLAEVADVFNRTSADVVCTDGLVFTQDGTVVRSFLPTKKQALNGILEEWDQIFFLFGHATPSATVFRREIFQEVGEFDLAFPICHDCDWLVRAALSGFKCVQHPKKLAFYRSHGTNLTAKTDRIFENYLNMHEKGVATYRKSAEWQRKSGRYARQWLPMILTVSREKSLPLLRRAMSLFPQDPAYGVANRLSLIPSGLFSFLATSKRKLLSYGKPHVDTNADAGTLIQQLVQLAER